MCRTISVPLIPRLIQKCCLHHLNRMKLPRHSASHRTAGEGKKDAVPFIKYLLGTILVAYKDFEDKFSIVEDKRPAINMVRKATLNQIGGFTKQDSRELCPSISVSSNEGVLRKLVKAGELKREARGKGTYYVRLK